MWLQLHHVKPAILRRMRHQTTIAVLTIVLAGCDEGGKGAVDAAGTTNYDATSTSIDGSVLLADASETITDASPALDVNLNPDATPNLSMSFFATSTGSGVNGGDLGGLAGADAKCQNLATLAGAGGRTWQAYLSTGATGPGPMVDARDRIGVGPWRNQQGDLVASSLEALHTDGLLATVILTELGALVPSNEHDILTGSATDGTLFDSEVTCNNWTDGTMNTQGQVGHADIAPDDEGESWNSQHSGSCDQASLMGNAGAGRLYCFAID